MDTSGRKAEYGAIPVLSRRPTDPSLRARLIEMVQAERDSEVRSQLVATLTHTPEFVYGNWPEMQQLLIQYLNEVDPADPELSTARRLTAWRVLCSYPTPFNGTSPACTLQDMNDEPPGELQLWKCIAYLLKENPVRNVVPLVSGLLACACPKLDQLITAMAENFIPSRKHKGSSQRYVAMLIACLQQADVKTKIAVYGVLGEIVSFDMVKALPVLIPLALNDLIEPENASWEEQVPLFIDYTCSSGA